MTTNPLSPDELVLKVSAKLREALDVCIDDGDGAIDVKGLAEIAIAAMPELTVQGWQPIETAPKDGTEIVLLDANVKTPAVGEWMIDVAWLNVGKKPGECLAKPGWFPLATPTHWMPLPEPPVESSNG